MEEIPPKRQREEEEVEVEVEVVKRQKSYSYRDILSFLEGEEEHEPNQDLSSLITTLQQEICSSTAINDHTQLSTCSSDTDPFEINPSSSSSVECTSLSASTKEEADAEAEKVMRHLLQASDDELGIPNSEEPTVLVNGNGNGNGFDSHHAGVSVAAGDLLLLDDCLWEIEDEAANYYTLLLSELFMY